MSITAPDGRAAGSPGRAARGSSILRATLRLARDAFGLARAAWAGAVVGGVLAVVLAAALSGLGYHLGAGPLVDMVALGGAAALILALAWAIVRGLRRLVAATLGTALRRLERRRDMPSGDAPAAVVAAPAAADAAPAAADAAPGRGRPSGPIRMLRAAHGWLAHPARTSGLALATLAYVGLVSLGPPMSILGPNGAYVPLLIVALAAGAATGLGRALWRGPRGRARTVTSAAAFGLAAVLIVGLAGFAAWPGPAATAAGPIPPTATLEADLSDPGAAGPYTVTSTAYGAGIDPRRPEFGPDTPIRTRTVDASGFLPDLAFPSGDYVRWFTGGGTDTLPLNALVWMPDGPGPFPLFVIVHGNHAMGHYSEPGYAYLGEHLASRGIITVSVDEAGLNGSFVGDFDGAEVPVRAWLLLQHLALWRDWNADPASPFHGRVDMERVALGGHSRGGEAASVAAWMAGQDEAPLDGFEEPWPVGLDVDAVVAIAPSDMLWPGPRGAGVVLEGVDLLELQGGMDADVQWWDGIRQLARTDYSADPDGFAAAVWARRANHGRFSSVWDVADAGSHGAWLLDQGSLLSQAEQQDVAKTVIAGFLEASLRGDDRYRALFRIPAAGRAWLPDDVYVTRLREGSTTILADFELGSGVDASSAIVEGSAHLVTGDLPSLRSGKSQGNRVGTVSWRDSGGSWTIPLGGSAGGAPPVGAIVLGPEATLRFAAAPARPDGGTVSFSVELVDGDGDGAVLAMDTWGGPLAPIPRWLFKAEPLARIAQVADVPESPFEPLLQTYALPLGAFAEANPAFDPATLAAVRFRFAGPPNALHLDEVGLAPG